MAEQSTAVAREGGTVLCLRWWSLHGPQVSGALGPSAGLRCPAFPAEKSCVEKVTQQNNSRPHNEYIATGLMEWYKIYPIYIGDFMIDIKYTFHWMIRPEGSSEGILIWDITIRSSYLPNFESTLSQCFVSVFVYICETMSKFGWITSFEERNVDTRATFSTIRRCHGTISKTFQ